MKITFIYTPFQHKKFNENVSVVDNEFGVYQPMGLAYAAAILRESGAEVSVIDANAEKLSKEEVFERLKALKPDVLGFDQHSAYVFYDTYSWIGYFKKLLSKEVKTLVGGFNMNLYAREIMTHLEIDYGFVGPLNLAAEKLVGFFDGKVRNIDVPGLVYRIGDELKINEQEQKYANIETMPYPARDLLPMDKYYSYISKRKNFTVMLAQTGCPFRCSYCAVAQIPYTKRSVENVFSEMLECYEQHGVRDFDFFDGTFTADKKLVYDLCDKIISSKLDIYWSCRTRVDCVDEELIMKMAKSGCQRIYYGIESVDKAVLEAVQKDLTPDKFSRAIKLTKKYRIEPLLFYMIGNPKDTVESFKDSIKFAKKIGAEYIQICRTIAKPKTKLDRELQEVTGHDYWSEYLRGEVEEKRMPNPWCEISEEQMEKLIKRHYMSFYFRPTYVLRRLRRLRSFHELRRFIKVGVKMFFSSFRQEDK